MAFKGLGDWSDLHLDGFLAWVHRFVMFITFPIRHFWKIVVGLIAIVLLLLIVPLYCGAQFGHIGEWYKSVIPVRIMLKNKNKVVDKVTNKVDEIKQKVDEISDTVAEITAGAAAATEDDALLDDEPRFAKWNVGELKKAEYKPKQSAGFVKNATDTAKNTFSVLKKLAAKSPKEQEINHKSKETHLVKPKYPKAFTADTHAAPRDFLPKDTFFYEGKLTDYYERLENRGLVYADEPRVLYGSANVVGPNSLYVNHTFLFLYGIYTDKRIYDAASAERYLRDLTDNSVVYCALVARTAQTNTATGLCFVNGIFINKAMVNHNLASNVGLK